METVGQRIRAAREASKYNQATFAKLIGCGQSTLSEIETGETKIPSGKVLQRMAEVLGKTERWIIYGDDGELETPTHEEQELLSAFRRLPEEQQAALAATIKALASKN